MNKIIPSDCVLIPDTAQRVFQGKIFDVYQWPQKLFDGSEHTFEMLKRTDTVTAICVVGDKILVIDDEQPHLGTRQSFPGGRVDATDLSIETATQREVQEETGYSFNNWRLVKVSQPYRKMEWFVYVLLAWDESGKQEPKLDAGEKIQLKHVDFNELKQLVNNNIGYLGESQTLLKDVNSLQDLLAMQEFSGQTVDR